MVSEENYKSTLYLYNIELILTSQKIHIFSNLQFEYRVIKNQKDKKIALKHKKYEGLTALNPVKCS